MIGEDNINTYINMEGDLKSFLKDKGASEYLANEVYQDLFIKIYDNGALKYKEVGKFKGWVKHVARNMLTDTFRKGSRSKECALLEFKDNRGQTHTILDLKDFNSSLNEEEFIIKEELKQEAMRGYNRLTSDIKEAMRLRVFCGLSFKEIAEEMDTSVSTSLGRIRYAKIRLKKEINW